MNGPAMLADHIDGRTDAIIAVWHDAVERDDDVPESDRLSYSEFVDHIPQILDRLTERLRGRDVDPSSVARKHGAMRWRQGYDIADVVVEMGHLRTALRRATFDYAMKHAVEFDVIEDMLTVVHEVLDEAVAESVAQFQEQSLAEIREIRAVVESDRQTLRTVLDSLPVGVWVLDAEGTIRQINEEGVKLQGFPAEEVVDRVNIFKPTNSKYRACRPDGTPYAPGETPAGRALRGELTGPEELIWELPSGPRIITANAVPLRGPTGVIAGATVVVEDVTNRRRLESELGASEVLFRTIVEQTPVMIRRSGVDGRSDFFNQRWLDFRGRSIEQEIGEGWMEGVHPDDLSRVTAAYSDAFAACRPFHLEYRILRRDGEYRWIADYGTPFQGADGEFRGYLGSCMDINDRHDLEDALKHQSELAEESSQHKTRLLAALSHDARTPLNAVVLSAQLLESHIADPAGNPEVTECLRTIRNSVKNVLDLLRDLLDLSRIDAGASPAEISRFEVEPVLSECLSSIEGQARQKGIDCRIIPDGLAGAVISTDRAKLKQILSNFLSNALRYTDRGHIRLYGDVSADEVRISVEDTGVGIASKDQSRIFDEFATLNQPHRVTGEGTGLGLAICRRLATLLKGRIDLKSERGQGSTFTLVLPASVLGSGPADEDTEGTAPPATAVATTRPVVVAEDDPSNRKILSRVLTRLGYRVLEAGNGLEAIAMVESEHPLAVLMDVNMPDMNGIEATLRLRSDPRFRNLPIFALTGDVSVVNRRKIGDAGVDGYLEKPVTMDQLRRTLGSLAAPPN